MVNKPCELIDRQIGALYHCEPIDGYVRISTPFLLPDGDVIDLFLRDDGGHHTLTDLGETTRWLRMQTSVPRRTDRQTRLIADVCKNFGIEFYRGALNLRVPDTKSFADKISRLGQACVRVSDVWFTMRSRVVESVTEEVAAFLTENKIPFDQGEKRPGRSGRMWTVDFHTRTPDKSSLIQVLTTGTTEASHRLAEHVLAQWVDLYHLRSGPAPGIRFISLFDDTVDVWKNEDFNLLSNVSDVRQWSRPDELLSALVT
jgi:hypothetical protein